ncbi:MAG: helix-turn-helix domain-containing protein [Chloroflexota bacterium]
MPQMIIPTFSDINQLHEETGFDGRTDLPEFHVFSLQETYPSTKRVMTPYKLDYFQLTFFDRSDDARLSMDIDSFDGIDQMLAAASPDHLLAWVRGEQQRGYALFFKREFLSHLPIDVSSEFPFFDLSAINSVKLDLDERAVIDASLAQLYQTFNQPHPYRKQRLQGHLAAFLYQCRHLFELRDAALEKMPSSNAVVHRFRQLVNQRFLREKHVDFYAKKLAISPDHLGKLVKEVIGQTPRQVVHARILLEAKRLLLYSDLTSAEIGAYLGFEEGSHFSRFFRRYVDQAPLSWRKFQRVSN